MNRIARTPVPLHLVNLVNPVASYCITKIYACPRLWLRLIYINLHLAMARAGLGGSTQGVNDSTL